MNGLDNPPKVRNSHWTLGSGIHSFIISESLFPFHDMSNHSLFLRNWQTAFLTVYGGENCAPALNILFYWTRKCLNPIQHGGIYHFKQMKENDRKFWFKGVPKIPHLLYWYKPVPNRILVCTFQSSALKWIVELFKSIHLT